MASVSVEKAPVFKVAGWYVCYWDMEYKSWVFDTKKEAEAFAREKAKELPDNHHLNVGWLSPPVKGRLSCLDIMHQIYSRMSSTNLHDMRKMPSGEGSAEYDAMPPISSLGIPPMGTDGRR